MKETVRPAKPSVGQVQEQLRTKAVRLENQLILDKTSGKYGDIIHFHGSFIVPVKEEADADALIRVMLNYSGGLRPLTRAPFVIQGKTVEEPVLAGEIKAGYRSAFKSVDHMFFGDDRYEPSVLEHIQRVLDEDKTDQMQYIFPRRDCENFAFALMGALNKDERTVGMPKFINWVDWVSDGQLFRHAINSFYLDGRVTLIEPQTDEKYSVPADWTLYLLIG